MGRQRWWMCLEQDPNPSNTYLWSLRYRYLEPHELSPSFFQSKTNPFLSARGVLGVIQATRWSSKKGSVGTLRLPPLPRGRSGASHMASLPFYAAQTLPEGKEDWRALHSLGDSLTKNFTSPLSLKWGLRSIPDAKLTPRSLCCPNGDRICSICQTLEHQ